MGARDGEDELIEVVLHDVGQAAEQDEEHGHLLRVLRARVYVCLRVCGCAGVLVSEGVSE